MARRPCQTKPMVKSQYRRYGNLVYGIDTFRGLFNDRQLYVLGSLCEAVRAAHDQMLAEGHGARPRGRSRHLSRASASTRIADYDSSFTSWRTTGEASRSTFRASGNRNGLGLHRDRSASRMSQAVGTAHVRWIELAIRHCSASSRLAAQVCSAATPRTSPSRMARFDAVIVDPPYYDAIQYGDLSDFFYVWLKRSIGHLHPGVFGTPLTPKQQEVIESRADQKSPEYISHDEFERRLQRALGEMARVVKRDGIVAIVFAHTDVEAWERLLRALRSANLVVTTSWPMRSEREAAQHGSDQCSPRLVGGSRMPSSDRLSRRASTTTWSGRWRIASLSGWMPSRRWASSAPITSFPRSAQRSRYSPSTRGS